MPNARTVVPKNVKNTSNMCPEFYYDTSDILKVAFVWTPWFYFFYVLFCTKTSSSTVEKQLGYTTTVLLIHSSAMKYNDCPSLFPVMNYFTFNIKFNNHLYTNLNFHGILCFLRSFQTHPMWSTALLLLEAKT